jgi:hypothetical protein
MAFFLETIEPDVSPVFFLLGCLYGNEVRLPIL